MNIFKILMKNRDQNLDSVDGIKNHTASAIAIVHTISFGIFDVGYIILERVLRTYLPDIWWAEVLKAGFVALAYVIIYKIVKAIYNYLISLFNPKFDIEGEWYHVHIPNDFLNDNVVVRKTLSAGVTTIKRDLNDFTFNSDNYDFSVGKSDNGEVVVKQGNVIRTHWCTETSEICDGNDFNIVEVYRARSERRQTIEISECPICHSRFENEKYLEEASDYRYGIHMYRIDTRNNMIICDYSDCFPSLKSGKMYLYKTEEERNKKIIKYFENNHA